MSTGPLSPGGVTTLISVAEAMLTCSARARPKRTSTWVLPGTKPEPLMVTWSPPALMPWSGSTSPTFSGPPLDWQPVARRTVTGGA